MNKYIYDNVEINEGVFVILQTIEAFEGKYYGALPKHIEDELKKFKSMLINEIEGKDKYEEIDFADIKLIQQFIYNKDEVEKNIKNKNQ